MNASSPIFWIFGMSQPRIEYIYICILAYWHKGMFANGPEDLGSILGRLIPKTQKMVLDAFLLNSVHYKVQIKHKWSNPGKRVVPSSTPWCSSYWKASLWVDLDYA